MVRRFGAAAAVLLVACIPQGRSGDAFPVFSADGAWCWFQDPRAVYVAGKHQRTYATWMTRAGKLQIGAYDHGTGTVQTFTLKDPWDRNDHNTASILVLPDRRLMVFYTRHSGIGIFCRSTARPEDIRQWEDEITVANNPRTTYSHPVFLSDEDRIYVFWRGQSWKPTYAWSADDGKTWTEPQILIQEKGRETVSIRPYLKVASDGKSTIHFTFTDGHPRSEPENSVYYLKYQDGVFFKADGTRVGTIENLPIQHRQSDIVYDGKSTKVRAWIWDIALDQEGRPVIAYTRLPRETDHRYHYARWNGETWLDTEITPAGPWFPQTPPGKTEIETHYSGGMAIDPSDPSVVYVSRPVNTMFEIEKWTTADQGVHWSATTITRNSKYLNVRPVVPRGYTGEKDHVLWMHGDYIHYTFFWTEIRMLEP